MEIWGHQFVGALPIFGDHTTIFGAGLIVEHLEVDSVFTQLDAGHDLVVGRDAITIALRLERLDMDRVVVAVVSEHNIFVPTARADREPAHIGGVELADVASVHMQLVGGNVGAVTMATGVGSGARTAG